MASYTIPLFLNVHFPVQHISLEKNKEVNNFIYILRCWSSFTDV